MSRTIVFLAAASVLIARPAHGQWTNRYPKVDGYGHHVYLEGYELPTLTAGPIDPAPSPDGRSVAFASRGWIWLLDLQTSTARRITAGAEMDSRPAWSPDGTRLAFVRDDGADTRVVIRRLESGDEQVIDTPAIDLDPAFSSDGRFLYLASAAAGTIDLWRHELETGERTPVTRERGLELRPQPAADGAHLLYLAKAAANDIRWRDLATGRETILASEQITSMTRPALSPDGSFVAYNWPTQERYELRVLRVEQPGTTVLLTPSDGLPLTPAWGPDGSWIYFAEADGEEAFHLKRIRAVGGAVETIAVRRWEWGVPTGTIRIATTGAAGADAIAARLSVLDAGGHPAIPDRGQSRFDGQNGRVFFYSPGVIEVTVPAGEVQVSAVQGLATPESSVRTSVGPGEVTDVTLPLTPVWDAQAQGWLSGDHHFHLNYGGQYRLTPDDLPPMMAGEALDMATPLIANLHNRFEEQRWWNTPSAGTAPIVRFGQEVRSHFLGHVGLLDIADLFWPWVWGPGYQVYGTDDRPNEEALAWARRQGGTTVYVHPYSGDDPFSDAGLSRIPVELVADGVLGEFDLLEISCLWSEELATSEIWYRLLNIGVPIAPSAGTDVMNNFYHTMAVGATRVYVYTGGAADWDTYADALRAGRSFVTTGPFVEFRVDDTPPGGTIAADGRARWELDLHSAVAVNRVEVLVNGEVVWSGDGVDAGRSRSYRGNIDLPAGGWVAVRAYGGETVWPAMGNYPFAHSAPVWIGTVGSTDPASRRAAAQDLMRALEVATARLRAGYRGTEIPRLEAHFSAARERLTAMLDAPASPADADRSPLR